MVQIKLFLETTCDCVSNSTSISADYHVLSKTCVGQSLDGDTCSQKKIPHHLANLPLISELGYIVTLAKIVVNIANLC